MATDSRTFTSTRGALKTYATQSATYPIVALLVAGYTYNEDHEDLADITGELSGGGYARVTLAGVQWRDQDGRSYFEADDPTFASLTATDIDGIVFASDRGADSASPLVSYVSFPPTDVTAEPFTFELSDGAIAIIEDAEPEILTVAGVGPNSTGDIDGPTLASALAIAGGAFVANVTQSSSPAASPATGDLWVRSTDDVVMCHYWGLLPDGDVDADSVADPQPWETVTTNGPGGVYGISDASPVASSSFAPLRVGGGALRAPHEGGTVVGVNPVYAVPAPSAGKMARYSYCLGEWLNDTITANGGNTVNIVPTTGVHGLVLALAVRDDAGPKGTIRIGGDMPTFHWVSAKNVELDYLPGPGDVITIAIDRDAREFWCEINGTKVGHTAAIVAASPGDDTVEVDGVQVLDDGATGPGTFGTTLDFDDFTLWSTPTKRQDAGGWAASCRWVAISEDHFDAADLSLQAYNGTTWEPAAEPLPDGTGLMRLDSDVAGVGTAGEVVAESEVVNALAGGGGVSLGETSSTAYRGDRGKIAYDHSQVATGNPHAVTKTDVGLSAVTNDAQAKLAWTPPPIIKTADQTNATDTLADDNELSFAIGANDVWVADFWLSCSGNTTGDIKVTVSAPAGATAELQVLGSLASTSTPSQIACGYIATPGTDVVACGVQAGASTRTPVRVVGTVFNSSTAGNITIRWAQNTSDATAVKVRKGSYLKRWRVS